MKSSETESLLKRETKGGTLKPGSVKHWKRSRLGILSVVICFYFLPLCISTYLLNEWIQHSLKEQYFKNGDFNGNFSSCEDANHSSNAYKTYTKVQQNSAHWIMYINVASHVTAFISNLILPGYTDTYGRKFSIILSLVGMTVRSGTLCLIIYTNKKFIYIVAAYAVDGLTGSYFALLNVGFSYVADIVKEPKERVLTIVVIASIEVISAMISGLVAGLCVEKFGFSIPALGCTGMVFCGLILVIAFLPESLAQELRTKPVSILASLKRPFEFYTSSTFAGKRLEYVLLLLAFAFAELGSTNRSPMETVYLLGMPFCWTPKKIGYFSLARHFGQVVIGLGSVKLFQKCMSNELIAITSTVSCIAGYIVEGLATSELAIYMVAVICVFSYSMIPVIRGIMSTITPADKQGSLFASVASVEVIGSITANISENTIYAVTVSVINGFVFFVMAGYIFIDLIMLVFYACIKGRRDKVYTYDGSLQHETPDGSLIADVTNATHE